MPHSKWILYNLLLIKIIWNVFCNHFQIAHQVHCHFSDMVIEAYWAIVPEKLDNIEAKTLADDTFKCKFINGNVLIVIKNSLKFVPKGPINKISSLVQIMAWPWPGN